MVLDQTVSWECAMGYVFIYTVSYFYSTLLIFACMWSKSLVFGYQGDFVGVRERIKVGCPSCPHH